MIETMTYSNTATSGSELVSAAEALRPLVEESREALSKGPDLPVSLAEALIQAGLTQLWLPRTLGGPEIEPLLFVQVIEALAKLDGALGWCASISSNASRFAGLIAAEPMRRLMPAGDIYAFSGSGHPTGTITRDGEGWRINGRWTWASFSRYSSITALVCMEQEHGGPRKGPDGRPVLRAALLPSSKVEVQGNWNSGGLRSSGSHDVTCTDQWVPDDSTTGMEMAQRQSAPLFSLPLTSASAIAMVGVPLGIAAASIDALLALAQTKVAFMASAPLREQEHVQLEVAWAKTRLLAARAFALEAVEAIWSSVASGGPAPVEQQALLRMACSNVGDAGKEIVGRMYTAAGSTAVLEEMPFSAQLRDMYAACQHINFATRVMVPPGRILLGLEPGTPMI
jgi:alkylation response protein AidB-like acyl-CoA dehydrogenase